MEEISPNLRRLRLFFANNILTKFQKKDCLNRSWILLKPQFETISDLVFYLLESFDLHDSCPHGIILSLDGFAMPEFESTAILKDKDVIRVEKKGAYLLDANTAIEEVNTYLEDEIVEKQPLPSGVKLLASEEFNKGTGGYQSETDQDDNVADKNTLPLQTAHSGDVPSRKRKAMSKIESPKKKKQRQITPEAVQENHVTPCEHIVTPLKKKKHGKRRKQNVFSSPGSSGKCTVELDPDSSSSELEKSKKNTEEASVVSEEDKKEKRCTLRKRKQRLIRKLLNENGTGEVFYQGRKYILRERKRRCSRKLQKGDEMGQLCEIQQPVKDPNKHLALQSEVAANCSQESDSSDAEDDLVPVVIRPGHIRFTRSGKVKDVQLNQEVNALEINQNGSWGKHPASGNGSNVKDKKAKEPYCWNGIASKRKGQKWGQDKQTSSSWKESRDYSIHSSTEWGPSEQATPSWKESGDLNGRSSIASAGNKKWTADWKGLKNSNSGRKHPPNDNYVDFDKLVPLIDSPKAGDIVAYRLLELTSSWCPELSSFRVGKITSFEPDSKKIILVPVPEYPLDLPKRPVDEDDDNDGQPPAASLYNEDGSLETDLSSLCDVRILKLNQSIPSEVSAISAANAVSASSTSKKGGEAQDASRNAAPAPSKSEQRAEAHDSIKKVASEVDNQELRTPAPVNGKKDPWEEISAVLLEKKAQLSAEDKWNKKDDTAKRSWSYRTLRGNAIGPTMARLRAQNGI